MFNKYKIVIGLFLFQLTSQTYAACCVSQYSAIDGIVVDSSAELQDDGNLHYTIGSASIFDKDKESKASYNGTLNFVKSCQAHKIFYVDAFSEIPFKCDMDVTKKIDISDEGGNWFTLQPLKPINVNKQRLHNIKSGMNVDIISTKPLKYINITFKNLAGKELSFYSKLTRIKTKKIKLGKGYIKSSQLKNNIYRSEAYEVLPKKYTQNGFEFIFVPSYTLEDELSLDIVSAVFIKNSKGKIDYLGELSGCMVRTSADLNNDGFSELVLAECEPGEGGGTAVNSVYPKIKTLASWYVS